MPKSYNQIMVHSLHKCGSMFLYRLFRDIAVMINIEMLSHNNDPPDTKLISRIENTDAVQMFSKYIICHLDISQ